MVQIRLVSLQEFQNSGAQTEMKLNKETTVKRFPDNTIIICDIVWDYRKTRAEEAYLQGLHGEVWGVVVVDFPGVPGSFFMQIVSCLIIQTNSL